MTKQPDTQMLFYKNITALSLDVHKTTGFTPATTLEFSAATHWVPVAGSEFASLSRHYPIIFVREGEGDSAVISAIALLGLSVGHNDYLQADMTWRADTYVPAFIRRYPFVPATSDEAGEQLTICIDDSAPHFKAAKNSKDKPKALFDTQGEPSQFLQDMIQFLQSFQHDMQLTRLFIDSLKQHDLLTQRSAQIHGVGGSVFTVADMLVVDEDKLNALDGAALCDLAQKGYLGWIYAHLLSLGNLTTLFGLHQKRLEAQPAKA